MTQQESSVTLPEEPADPSTNGSEPRPPRSQRVLATIGLLVLAVSALLGGNLFGLRESLLGSETPEPKAPAASRTVGGSTATTVAEAPTLVRSQPWWQDVTVLEGVGTSRTESFDITEDALQWRVRGTCETGRLVVKVPARPRPLLEAACTGSPTEYGITSRPGNVNLEVTAEGPWRLEVQQQVDVPLVEPPLPSMSAPETEVVATGEFYRIDQTGNGTITIYRLADGTYALRLDKFFVTANVDLEIRLHPLEAPRTSEDYLSAPAPLAAPLDITTGSLNFIVPNDVDPTKYKSVVIWCPLINSAYAAATLKTVA